MIHTPLHEKLIFIIKNIKYNKKIKCENVKMWKYILFLRTKIILKQIFSQKIVNETTSSESLFVKEEGNKRTWVITKKNKGFSHSHKMLLSAPVKTHKRWKGFVSPLSSPQHNLLGPYTLECVWTCVFECVCVCEREVLVCVGVIGYPFDTFVLKTSKTS